MSYKVFLNPVAFDVNKSLEFDILNEETKQWYSIKQRIYGPYLKDNVLVINSMIEEIINSIALNKSKSEL